jgi:chorismate mutase-like protein
MSQDKPSIDSLRREIDRIDDAIHDLLMKRTEVVALVAAAKPPEAVPLRPAREAEVLRRLVARHTGPFPKAAVVRIWREIMGALVRIQGPFTVAVCDGVSELAREHFGSVAATIPFRTPGQAVRALVDGQAAVAVVPMPPPDEEAEPWWLSLTADAGLMPGVVARLPFAGAETPKGAPAAQQGLVLACRPHDKTGDDRTLLVVETAPDLSRDRLRAVLGAAGLEVTELLAVHRGVRRLHLTEVNGFVEASDPRLIALAAARDPVERASVVGGYATPFTPQALA